MKNHYDTAQKIRAWTARSSKPMAAAGVAISFVLKRSPSFLVELIFARIGVLGSLTHMSKSLDPDEISPRKIRGSTTTKECEKLENVRILDEVVVGSGPCGGLVQFGNGQKGLNSLIIEKGVSRNLDIPPHTPSDMFAHFSEAGLQMIIGSPTVPFAQGEVVGGGGVVNSGLYHRIPKLHRENFQKLTGISGPDIDHAQTIVEKILKIEAQDAKSLGIYSESPIEKISRNLNWDGGTIPRWRKYSAPSSFSHHSTLDLVNQNHIVSGHEVTQVLRRKSGQVYAVKAAGESCEHLVYANSVALCGGPVSTPRLLNKSGLAPSRKFFFSFHHMQRTISLWDRPVNDLQDIDPYQAWSKDGIFKIGAAVSTREMLRLPLGLSTQTKDFSRWASHYISTPSSGIGGMTRIFGSLWPFFFGDLTMRRTSREARTILTRELRAAGALEIAELPPSTVHVFGSIPIGRSRLIDGQGFVRESNRSIRVRDASLIPFPLNVNPQGPALTLVGALERIQSAPQSC